MAEIIRINEKTWRIEDGGVRFFVLDGDSSAVVIDSGMNTPDAKAIAESITRGSVCLINTHADIDHISGNDAFDEVYIHPADIEKLLSQGKTSEIIPVFNGMVFDPGNRPLKIIELPGHTPGSIAVLDVNARVLYGGDSIQDGRIFMFGEGRDLKEYIKSLRALIKNHGSEFDVVYPSHASPEVDKGLALKLADAAEKILEGKVQHTEAELFGQKIAVYNFGFATFLCEK